MSCPAQDRGLSKGIKYSYTLFGVGEAPGDALRGKEGIIVHEHTYHSSKIKTIK
jgi:hypothetical protein